MRQAKHTLTLALALLAGSAGFGCSEDDPSGDSSGNAGRGGSSAEAGTGANAGTTAAGGAGKAGGGAGGGAGSSAAGQGGAGKAGGGAGGGGAGGSAYTEEGVCGQRGRSTVDADSFEGYEEFYIISDKGFGDDICVVRFDVKRVGAGPTGCDDPAADVDCLWTHEIEYSNPSMVTDVNGVCAKSELGLDAEAIAEIDGKRVAYGYVSEYVGHNSVILQWDEATMMWGPAGNATWNEDDGSFRFDNRDGTCYY